MDNAEQRGNDGANNSSQDSFGLLASRFEALRKLPAAQREQALATLEREDPGLTTMLRRLFAQHSDDPDELAAPDKAFAAEELASAAAQLREPLPMPAAIGPY